MAKGSGTGKSGGTKVAGGKGTGTAKPPRGYGPPGGWPSTVFGVPSGKNRGNAPPKKP